MTTTGIIWLIVGILLFFGVLTPFILGYILYSVLLVRTKKEKWGHEISEKGDKLTEEMWEAGIKWAEEKKAYKKEVHIVSDGFNLYGEYFDFGFDKAVICVPGRSECLMFSYYYGECYEKAGVNVLCIDNRSHGFSDGRYNSLGFKEYRDLLSWGKLLHEEYHMDTVLFHGICVGCSASLFALTDKSCPSYMKGMVAEGMYANFYESFKLHMVVMKKPLFPLLQMVMFYEWLLAGAHPVTDGPLKRIDRLEKPILFLHSKADLYSTPERAEELYEKCRSDKKIVWYEKASHSRIRINFPESYDSEVKAFVSKFD